MQTSPDSRILIIADAHLPLDGRRGSDGLHERFMSLLEHYRDTLQTLVLLGDTFDFWYEWEHVFPSRALPLLRTLRSFRDAGVDVHVFAGNHDFKFGYVFPELVGATVHMDAWEVTIDGLRYYFHHGDGLAPSDRNYRRMKAVFRSRIAQTLFGWIHPDLAMDIGRKVSGMGEPKRRELEEISPPFTEYKSAAQRLLKAGQDVVVIGHVHQPFLEKFEEGSFFNPGPFIGLSRYGLIEGDLPRSEVWK